MRVDIGEIHVDLHHLLEGAADRGQRGFEILERLHRLAAEVGRHLAGRIGAQLPCDIDDAARAGCLDHVGVAARRVDVGWIDIARAGHREPPLTLL